MPEFKDWGLALLGKITIPLEWKTWLWYCTCSYTVSQSLYLDIQHTLMQCCMIILIKFSFGHLYLESFLYQLMPLLKRFVLKLTSGVRYSVYIDSILQ